MRVDKSPMISLRDPTSSNLTSECLGELRIALRPSETRAGFSTLTDYLILTPWWHLSPLRKSRMPPSNLVVTRPPGPDSFPLLFFQTFWESVKNDILKVFIELQEDKLFTGPTDYSFVCLIPKKEGTHKAKEYRPISLINGIQKIISKVLANRLALSLPSIISPT